MDQIAEPAPIYPTKFEKCFDYDDEGNIKKESVWVTWTKKGTGIPTGTTDKVERVKKDPAIWAAIEPYYKSWMEGNEIPETGTPLTAWGGVEAHQIEVLKKHKIFSVEDFAGLSDGDLGRIAFPGVRERHSLAKKWLAGKEGKDEMEALRQRIAELEAQKQEPEPDGEIDDLRKAAEQLGIKVDKRWSKDTLITEIEKVAA